MTTITWLNPVSGDFNTPSDWSTGTIPSSTDDAVFNASGTYTVTSSSDVTVNSLSTNMPSTLSVRFLIGSGTTFTMTNGTGTGANDGATLVAGTLQVGGTVKNTFNGFTGLSGITLVQPSGSFDSACGKEI